MVKLDVYATPGDYAGLGHFHRLAAWTDAEGFPRSVVIGPGDYATELAQELGMVPSPLAIGFDYAGALVGAIAPHPIEGWGWIKRLTIRPEAWTEDCPTPVEA